NTVFGKDHKISGIKSIDAFQQRIPLHTYNQIEPYIQRSLKGEENILWDKPVQWFALSSGTSSAKSKFIPMNRENLQFCHYKGMLTILSSYVRTFPKSKLFLGKSLTLGGNRHIDKSIDTSCCYGDLSAFLLINTPLFARMFTTPTKRIGLIPDFEYKIEQVSKLIARQNLVSFSGVPSWNLILMRKVLEITGKSNLSELWPHMELFMHGGVSFEPYRVHYKSLFPSPDMHYLETYNASEGFFAFQTSYTRFLTMDNVEKDKPYAMVISTNSGLWRYLIGDTVRFTGLYPHKIRITGRTRLFINTFGEELMIENAERALAHACDVTGASVHEYTVAPVFMDTRKKGTHQWLIEFESMPPDMETFTQILDRALMDQNSDYEAKRLDTGTMDMPQITSMKTGSFYRWMALNDKLGGQNKVPRLWSTRQYAEALLKINEGL
ncbi:MAG TPA: GH3 auxin-responsive promoter family protein, partial [Bacteroidales bacterium]|nr:GH3 auxin-responsive promoter family protein [Bacteroidales bacterium]